MQERWRHARIEFETKALRQQFMASFPEQCFAHATTNPLAAHKSAQISVKSENFCGTTSWQAPCAHVEVGAEAGQHEVRQLEMSVSSFFCGLEERENQFGVFLSFPVMSGHDIQSTLVTGRFERTPYTAHVQSSQYIFCASAPSVILGVVDMWLKTRLEESAQSPAQYSFDT